PILEAELHVQFLAYSTACECTYHTASKVSDQRSRGAAGVCGHDGCCGHDENYFGNLPGRIRTARTCGRRCRGNTAAHRATNVVRLESRRVIATVDDARNPIHMPDFAGRKRLARPVAQTICIPDQIPKRSISIHRLRDAGERIVRAYRVRL